MSSSNTTSGNTTLDGGEADRQQISFLYHASALEACSISPLNNVSKSNIDSSNIVYLSLYLLMLAFFIFLVSISSFNAKKSSLAMDSIHETFHADVWDPPKVHIEEMQEGGRFREKIVSLFEAILSDEKYELFGDGELLQVLVPARHLFTESGSKKSRFRKMMTALTEMMKHENDRKDLQLTVVVGRSVLPSQDTKALENKQVIKQGGEVVRSLIAEGTPRKFLSLGYSESQAGGLITFLFRMYGKRHSVEPQ